MNKTDPYDKLRDAMKRSNNLPRNILSGSYLDCKKFFRKGYPPDASVLDIDFYQKRFKAYDHYKVFIDNIEDLWGKAALAASFRFSNTYTPDLSLDKAGLKNDMVNMLTINSFFLNKDWRINLAAFYYTHWDENINIAKFWVLFLMSETGQDISKTEFKIYMDAPLQWVVSMAETLIFVKNEEVLG